VDTTAGLSECQMPSNNLNNIEVKRTSRARKEVAKAQNYYPVVHVMHSSEKDGCSCLMVFAATAARAENSSGRLLFRYSKSASPWLDSDIIPRRSNQC
jgi:hypothetical protein